jgi:hypothetical protein
MNVLAIVEVGGPAPKRFQRHRLYVRAPEYNSREVAIDLALAPVSCSIQWLRMWVVTPHGWGVSLSGGEPTDPTVYPILSLPRMRLPKLVEASASLPAHRVVLVRFAQLQGWFEVPQ